MIEKEERDSASITSEPPAKKPYVAPVLVKFGTLGHMTRMKGQGPNADGGGKSSYNKTGRGGMNTTRGLPS